MFLQCHENLVHDGRLQKDLGANINNINREEGGGCADSYLIALFSPSSCPVTLRWIHEIVIITLMIAASHSADVGTDQIVKGENVNAMGKQLPSNRKMSTI